MTEIKETLKDESIHNDTENQSNNAENKITKENFQSGQDILTRATIGDARIYVARTTRLVRKMALRHRTSHVATAALGRTVTGALLLAATMKNNEGVGKKPVMLFKENGFNSEGTMRLFCYLGWILAALDQGRTIFIDEIDAKLHFLVADYIIGLFNSIEHNPKNAQLICTAHNVMLMDEGLRRDQIYFTSKDQYGRSSLVSLSDFNGVRKNDLFSKRYLAGFYASLPDLKGKE